MECYRQWLLKAAKGFAWLSALCAVAAKGYGEMAEVTLRHFPPPSAAPAAPAPTFEDEY
jgi:hypothetical protein